MPASMTKMDTFGFSASRPATTLPAVPPEESVSIASAVVIGGHLTSNDDEVELLYLPNRSHICCLRFENCFSVRRLFFIRVAVSKCVIGDDEMRRLKLVGLMNVAI